MARPKLKLLALHSFRTSGSIFHEQLSRAGLLQALDDLVEITFVDAPNPASGPIPDDVSPFFKGPYYEWWNAQRSEDDTSWTYHNAATSLAFIKDFVALNGPFDGLIGFSQGAAAASLIAGMQMAGELADPPTAPAFRFLILFAGIRVRDPRLEQYYAALRDVPSLHVIGDKDPVKRMTNHLIEAFEKPAVVNHARGHVIPALAGEDLRRVRAFLEARAVGGAAL